MLQLFTQMLFYYLPKKGAQKQRVVIGCKKTCTFVKSHNASASITNIRHVIIHDGDGILR